ncbi:MAG: YbbR-like domain-containing protein [Gemmatimonadetes bacterium]|nr:YbbR-like domain-containing protein [Gemmatimonadota bacterium]
MKRHFSLAALAHNWRLKLAALGLALLIWAAVSAEQVTSQWIPVRVDPVVRDPEFVLTGPPDPAEVRVRFSGPGRELWELALDRPSLVLPLSEIGNRRAFALDASMLRIPAGLSVNVQDIRPAVVRVDVERLASRVVPVRARLTEQSRQRYVVGDDLEVLPAEVRVTGPADRLAALDSVDTRRFDIVPDDSTFTHQVPLDTAGMDGLSFSRTRVRVSGPVDVRAERSLGTVPVSVPGGLVATPARVQVSVSGARRVLERVFAGGVRAYVPRDSLPPVVPPEGVEVPVVVDGLPPNTRARANPPRVRVRPEGAAPVPAAGLPPAPPDTAPAPAAEPRR